MATRYNQKENSPNGVISIMLQDMVELIRLLENHHFNKNKRVELNGLRNTIKAIENNLEDPGITRVEFDSTDYDIMFHTSSSGMDPSLELYENRITLYIRLKYSWNSDKQTMEEMFSMYDLNIILKGYDKNTGEEKVFGWHLDSETLPDDNGEKKRFLHPVFHLHAGGAKLKKLNHGDLFLLSSPRIPHPPMDLIMVVHFILCHFYCHNEKDKDLAKDMEILDDPAYKQIVERAVKRCYLPYYKKICHSIMSNNLVPIFS